MTPFAAGKRWTLYRGDTLFALLMLAEQGGRFSAVITDPPYSSGGMVRGDRAQGTNNKYLSTGSVGRDVLPEFIGDTRDQRTFTIWLSEIVARCLPLLAVGAPVLLFTDWRQLGATQDALQVGGLVARGIVPWLKPDGASRPQLGRFRQSSEFVVWGSKGPWPQARPGIGCLPGHFTAAAPRGEEREHTTEKPAELLEQLVQIVDAGGAILDPFCGSGSTGEAALRKGFTFAGVEASEEYCLLAARRLEQAERGGEQRPLFASREAAP